MNELEYALDTISGTPFEKLTADFLRVSGYEVHESGLKGTDGGWDARVELSTRRGIAHASTAEKWRQKIRSDADSVQDLEDERGENYDLFVFVTNQAVTGQQELDIEAEIESKYGWNVRIHHRENILGKIRTEEPGLADHLGVDVESERDHLEAVRELRDERIEVIQNRSGTAEDLQAGAAVALHVVPSGVFSNERKSLSGDVPELPILWEPITVRAEARGKYLLSTKNAGLRGPWLSYGLLRNDGLYETVTANGIVEHEEKGYLQLNSTSASLGFDATVVLTVRRALSVLEALGFRGTAAVSLSLLDASGTILSKRDRGVRPFGGPNALQTDVYATEPVSVTVGGDSLLGDLEPALSEVWREFGRPNGTENIEDGEWNGIDIRIGDDTIP